MDNNVLKQRAIRLLGQNSEHMNNEHFHRNNKLKIFSPIKALKLQEAQEVLLQKLYCASKHFNLYTIDNGKTSTID